jgi:hypothetical protein
LTKAALRRSGFTKAHAFVVGVIVVVVVVVVVVVALAVLFVLWHRVDWNEMGCDGIGVGACHGMGRMRSIYLCYAMLMLCYAMLWLYCYYLHRTPIT